MNTTNRIVAITSNDGTLSRHVYECNNNLASDGFRWAFKNTEDMELFIKFFEHLEKSAEDIKNKDSLQ